MLGEEVVEQERGGEQRPQEHLQGLVGGPVERVAAAAQVLVVDRREVPAVLAGVDEAAAADLRRRDQQVAGHRIVAIEALARFDPRAARGKHLGEAPDRDDAQPLAGREELPVAQGIAEGGIGDVVGGQGELADRQQRLAFRQRLRGGQVARTQGGGGELATLDHDFGDAGHGRFLRLRPCSRPDRRPGAGPSPRRGPGGRSWDGPSLRSRRSGRRRRSGSCRCLSVRVRRPVR